MKPNELSGISGNLIDELQVFFVKLAKHNLTMTSMTVGDEFWDKLALQIGVKHRGFYEGRFYFHAPFGAVEIIREHPFKVAL